MIPGKYIWMDGKLVPWEDAKIHVVNHSLHYGSAVFEGVRFYDTDKGVAIFRNNDHVERLFYSASFMEMKIPYTKEEIAHAQVLTIKESGLKYGYMRPLLYLTDNMGLITTDCSTHGSISCWGWGQYLGLDSIKVKTSSWRKIAKNADVCDAKIAGHYYNSTLATNEATKAGYHEALMLDQDGLVAEGPGENIFIVKNNKIYTPKFERQILSGITRSTIMTIAKDLGYEVIEMDLKPEDVYNSDEAFFTGTAAEILPIESLDDKLIKNRIGPITSNLQKTFKDIVLARNSQYEDWLTFVA